METKINSFAASRKTAFTFLADRDNAMEFAHQDTTTGNTTTNTTSILPTCTCPTGNSCGCPTG